jgi:DNA-directed RNA polymerase subunit RPC12/RpoP
MMRDRDGPFIAEVSMSIDEHANLDRRPMICCPQCGSRQLTMNGRKDKVLDINCTNCRTNFTWHEPTITTSNRPHACPKCKSNRTGWKGDDFRCFHCGHRWTANLCPGCGSLNVGRSGEHHMACFKCGHVWKRADAPKSAPPHPERARPNVDEQPMYVRGQSTYPYRDPPKNDPNPSRVMVDFGGAQIPLTPEQIEMLRHHIEHDPVLHATDPTTARIPALERGPGVPVVYLEPLAVLEAIRRLSADDLWRLREWVTEAAYAKRPPDDRPKPDPPAAENRPTADKAAPGPARRSSPPIDRSSDPADED